MQHNVMSYVQSAWKIIVVLKLHNNIITYSHDSLTSYFPFGNLLISRKKTISRWKKKSRIIIYISIRVYVF